MISKFAPLTKLKKEQLEEVRRMLLEVNLFTQKLQKELLAFEADLNTQQTPQSGKISLFTQYTVLIQACHDQIILKKDEIYYAKQNAEKIKIAVKEALLEYEKFHYLQSQEEQAFEAKIKKEEAMLLDEIAIIGYNAKKN